MDWRELLKPGKRKVLLFIALFVIFVPFISYDNGIRCIRAPCPSSSTGSVPMFLMFSHALFIYGFQPEILVAGLVVSYLLSAAIVHLMKNK